MELRKMAVDSAISTEDEGGIVVLGRLDSDRQLDTSAEAKLLNGLLLG
jgi:hypothetical protein